jgi:signal transduction histidine kinase
VKDFRRLPKALHLAIGAVMLLSVWTLDLRTPVEASMSIFYLLPIMYVSWFCGGAWGYAAALFAAAAWYKGQILSGPAYASASILWWNTAVRLGYFVLMVVMAQIVNRLHHLSEHEREVSQLKSDMISLVSHEFGNSLTVFNLSLVILMESQGADDEAERQRCYANLTRVYTHLSGAVTNFLNLNRIESGRFVPHLGETALRTVAHAAIAQLSPLFESKGVSLRLDFPAERVPVKADPDALSVIMSNLIGNAVKYTPAGGAVTVRIATDAGAGTTLISVEDTGIGISQADRLLITSGFFRTEDGQKAAKGFGVGLKVTLELLKTLGSRLEIESEPGRGSKFSFRLPLWNVDRAAPAAPAP